MRRSDHGLLMKRSGIGVLCAATLVGICTFAVAQEVSPTTEAIVDALDPLKGARGRGLQVTPGQAQIAPSINLTVNFEFDSTKLDNETLLTLKRLGAALRDPRLRSYNFQIAGHTDAKGSDGYNQVLSERRAQVVRDHLIFFYDISPDRLKATGYGKTQLLDPTQPWSGVNRRVQIINEGPSS